MSQNRALEFSLVDVFAEVVNVLLKVVKLLFTFLHFALHSLVQAACEIRLLHGVILLLLCLGEGQLGLFGKLLERLLLLFLLSQRLLDAFILDAQLRKEHSLLLQ